MDFLATSTTFTQYRIQYWINKVRDKDHQENENQEIKKKLNEPLENVDEIKKKLAKMTNKETENKEIKDQEDEKDPKIMEQV